MKTATKLGLFGGALVAAGLAASPASADFSFGGGETGNAYVLDLFFFASDSDNFAGAPGSAYASYSGGGATGASYSFAQATSIGADISITGNTGFGGNGYATTDVFATNLSVSVDSTVAVTWDFTNGYSDVAYGYSASASLVITDITNSSVLASYSLGSSGTVNLNLLAGDLYEIDIDLATAAPSLSTASLSASVSIVPTPGAIALLGVAGIVGRRKRRR